MSDIEANVDKRASHGGSKTAPASQKEAITIEDVEKIFDCLTKGEVPPKHLSFQIIPVGPKDFALSPPYHRFEGTFPIVGLCSTLTKRPF